MIKAKTLEITGLFLVLLAFFVQSFILVPMEDLLNESEQYVTEEKIDIIYSIVRHNYSKLSKEKIGGHWWSNPKYHDEYKYAGDKKSTKSINSQTKTARYVFAFIFIIGSVLMLIGKVIELNYLKSSNN